MNNKENCDFFIQGDCTWDVECIIKCKGECDKFSNEYGLTGEE